MCSLCETETVNIDYNKVFHNLPPLFSPRNLWDPVSSLSALSQIINSSLCVPWCRESFFRVGKYPDRVVITVHPFLGPCLSCLTRSVHLLLCCHYPGSVIWSRRLRIPVFMSSYPGTGSLQNIRNCIKCSSCYWFIVCHPGDIRDGVSALCPSQEQIPASESHMVLCPLDDQ